MDVKTKDGIVEYRHPNFNCVWSVKPAENGHEETEPSPQSRHADGS